MKYDLKEPFDSTFDCDLLLSNKHHRHGIKDKIETVNFSKMMN